MCLPNHNNITLNGNILQQAFQTLDIRVMRCKGRDTCKSDLEIEEFLDKNGMLFFIANEQDYQKEVYTDDVILKRSIITPLAVDSRSRKIRNFAFE